MTLSPGVRLLRLAAAVAGIAALVAIAPELAGVLAVAAIALAAVALSDLLLLRRLAPPDVERVGAERAAVGERSEMALVIANHARVRRRLEITEELPDDVAPSEPHFAGLTVAARATARVAYAVCPRRRGDRALGPTLVTESSPLSLWRRRTAANAGQKLRVYPDVRHLRRRTALDPRRILAAYGVKQAPRRGDGLEFDSLRDYAAGDDTRRLDWTASARRGRPVVRVQRDEQHHRLVIALDSSRLMAGRMDGRSKLDHAVDAALALAFTALSSGDHAGLVVFDREIRVALAPRARRSEIGALLEAVRPLEPRLVEADYRMLAREIAIRQRQRSLVVILTDFVEAAPFAVTEPLLVLGRRHRVLLVALRDPIFADLAPNGRDEDALAPMRRIVLHELLQEREATLGVLRRGGVQTLDLEPRDVTSEVLNRYLAIRHAPQ